MGILTVRIYMDSYLWIFEFIVDNGSNDIFRSLGLV
jgi:hypothetical protein